METELVLVIASKAKDGELRREVTNKSAKQFLRYWRIRFMRYKRTSPEIRQAFKSGDVLVGWANYDDWVAAGVPLEELQAEYQRIFKSMAEYNL